jgi:hypothetical protein
MRLRRTIWNIVPVVAILLAMQGSAAAADIDAQGVAVPAPPAEQVGIWGAIAFSPSDGEHGIFWGADKREEAEEIALRHCAKRSRSLCELVVTYRNHRKRDDDDGTGFPYNHCAALAVEMTASKQVKAWGAASARGRRAAEDEAIQNCGPASQCRIVEAGCT